MLRVQKAIILKEKAGNFEEVFIQAWIMGKVGLGNCGECGALFEPWCCTQNERIRTRTTTALSLSSTAEREHNIVLTYGHT